MWATLSMSVTLNEGSNNIIAIFLVQRKVQILDMINNF